ncbi:MAG: hypothetical protein JSW64_15355 [Candidatus Zixiibacteriota bacterium]|nr:MAG: hypothetical protein JSW64_15355 [candidate division Zixibacteria bacterium]
MVFDIIESLRGKGWEPRFSASGPRLAEAIENYKSLGYEVKTIPVKELVAEGCKICFEDESDDSAMIFTRGSGSSEDDELFDE